MKAILLPVFIFIISRRAFAPMGRGAAGSQLRGDTKRLPISSFSLIYQQVHREDMRLHCRGEYETGNATHTLLQDHTFAYPGSL